MATPRGPAIWVNLDSCGYAAEKRRISSGGLVRIGARVALSSYREGPCHIRQVEMPTPLYQVRLFANITKFCLFLNFGTSFKLPLFR